MNFIITILVILFLIAIFGGKSEESTKESKDYDNFYDQDFDSYDKEEVKRLLKERQEKVLKEYFPSEDVGKCDEDTSNYAEYNTEDEYENTPSVSNQSTSDDQNWFRVTYTFPGDELRRKFPELNLAKQLQQSGEYEKAATIYERYIDNEDEDMWPAHRLCMCYRSLKEYEEEKEVLEWMFDTFEMGEMSQSLYERRLNYVNRLIRSQNNKKNK